MKDAATRGSEVDGYIDWKGWSGEQFGHFDRHAGRYYDWHVQRAVQPAAGMRVLELGFGNGSFLGYCRQRDWQATGVERDSTLRARAISAGYPTFANVAEIDKSQSFDLIALFDVLEHIPGDALVAFMAELRRRLAPDGAILLRVPNGDSPFGGLHQHGDLTHVTTFGMHKLTQLAGLCDLKLAALGEAPWHSQQAESRNLGCMARAAARACINKLVGFAYFRSMTIDLSVNLAAVLVPVASPRPAWR